MTTCGPSHAEQYRNLARMNVGGVRSFLKETIRQPRRPRTICEYSRCTLNETSASNNSRECATNATKSSEITGPQFGRVFA